MKRILALDVGDRRIGIAVSDPLGITAQGLETYTRSYDAEKDCEYIIQLLKKYEPVKLLFGLPKNMNGSLGFQSEKVKAFAELLTSKWDGEFDFYDERLTTVAAEKTLYEQRLNWKERRKVVDKVAAVIILEGYLASHPVTN